MKKHTLAALASSLITMETAAHPPEVEATLEQQRQWIIRSQGATIIPQYRGGYVIREFDGTTNVSKPDINGRVHIRRSGYLNRWGW